MAKPGNVTPPAPDLVTSGGVSMQDPPRHVSRRSRDRSAISRSHRTSRDIILVTAIVGPQGGDCRGKDRSQRGKFGAGKGAEDPALEFFDIAVALRADGLAEPGEAEQKRLPVGGILAALDQAFPLQQEND